MPPKEFFSAAAIALTLAAFYPYIRDILRGSVRPHVFSWVIWALTTGVVFCAQLQEQGGAGAWAIGVSAAITTFIAGLAFAKRADISISRLDWLFFACALLSLPLWYFTADPLGAVVLLTAVDLLGFGPTLRKAWQQPHAESPQFFALFLLRNVLVVLALERYVLTTWLFPVAVALACALVIAFILLRRRHVVPGGVPQA
jgi:hypothetical protein